MEAQEAPDAQEVQSTSTIEAWKRRFNAVSLELPNGLTARVRRGSLYVLLQTGRIPNPLLGFVQETLQGKSIKMSDASLEEIRAMMDLVDIVVVTHTDEPKVSSVPKDESGAIIPISDREPGKVWVDEIDEDSKFAIYNWVVEGVADFEPFREEPSGDVDAVPNGETVGVPAQSDPLPVGSSGSILPG